MSEVLAFEPEPRARTSFLALAGFLTAGLFLAGTIHICTILLVPAVAEVDGWSRLEKFAGKDKFAEIRTVGQEAGSVVGLDPLFVNGVCRLNLAEAPAAIALQARERFWSLALYDPRGTIMFSLNDRTAVEGRLDMLVVDPARNAELQADPAGQADDTIVVESQSNELIALLRLFAPTAIAQAEARKILAEADCLPEPLGSAAAPSSGR